MRKIAPKLLLGALFLGAEAGWIYLAAEASIPLALGVIVLVAIAAVFGRLIGGAAFLVLLVPMAVILVLYAHDPGQRDCDGENTAMFVAFLYGATAFVAGVGVAIGVLWRLYARWKTPRKSATVSANAESVASGS